MYVIGLDVGTTATKALVADDKGNVVAVGNCGYPLFTSGACVEQRAEDWIGAAVSAIKEATAGIDASQVAGMSLSTQGGSTVAVDAEGNFMGNALTWMDKRASEEMKEVVEAAGGEYIYRTTGWSASAATDASKLRYLKKRGEKAGAVKFYTTLEVMNRFLTGNPVIDPSNAAMRQLYNVEKGTWDPKMLEIAYVKEEELPEILPSGAKVGGLCEEAAKALGLPEGIPVFNGAHDQYCASIGSGCIHEGDMLISAGTTWVIMGVGSKPLFSETYIAPGKHPIEGLYGAIVSLIGSGTSMQWFADNFLKEDFAEMNRQAAERRDNAAGLFYFPYVTGAPYPIRIPAARGTFTGIALEHDRFDFARAIMEGVAFGVRRALEDFRANGSEIKKIAMMGGASKSALWCQLIASIAGVPIVKLNQADACAAGAAMIAACGLGIYKNYEEAAASMICVDHVYEPIPEDAVFYDKKYAEYDRFWNCMKEFYK